MPLLGVAASYPAQAQTIISAISYIATPAEGPGNGAPSYFDDTGKQLTDGVLGSNQFEADLGNGPAYEWVGGKTVDPTITFDFGQTVTIDSVDIGFNRREQSGIYIPPNVSIGGTAFTLAPDALVDDSRGFLTFNES